MSSRNLIGSQARRVAIAVLVAFVGLSGTTALGFWQYSRAHRDDISQRVLAAAAVPVRALVAPGSYVPESAFAHRVSVPGGTLRTDAALLSCNRIEHRRSGCWVVAPVYITPALASVALLGFADDATAQDVLDRLRGSGPMTAPWQGRLQPAETFDRGKAILPPSDTVTSINVNELAVRWNVRLLDGYIVISTPQAIEGLQPLTSSLILPPSGITWRNLIYAWQWWAFAAFVLFLLARYVIDVRNEAPTIPRIGAATGTAREDRP